MIVFWIVAALFLAGALLLLLPGLWKPRLGPALTSAGGANVAVYRDQLAEAERDLAADLITPERFEQARAEIQRRVLEDTAAAAAPPPKVQPARITALALAVLIPLASVATYLALGEPEAAAPTLAAPERSASGKPGDHSVSAEQIQKMVGALAERLKSDPNNAEGWLMLGRSYTALSRYRDAAGALRKASELLPNDPNVLADLADVLGMAQNRRLAGEPARIVQRALDLDPRHVKALALAGSVAFEAKDYASARRYWERLLAVVPAESDIARSIRGSISEATQLEGGAAAPAAQAAAPAVPAAPAIVGAAAAVSGQVVLSPELRARMSTGDTLFVFARAAEGPRLPLAIVKRTAGDLPLEFKLDDSMAMNPQFKLSGFPLVVVGARISKSGNATPQSGDLIGQSQPVAPGAQGLKVVIDAVQP